MRIQNIVIIADTPCLPTAPPVLLGAQYSPPLVPVLPLAHSLPFAARACLQSDNARPRFARILCAVREYQDDSNHLEIATWGFIPHWAKSQAKPIVTINSRAETVSTSPVFRHAFENNRCLIPFSHFYEWKKEATKIPYAIGIKNSEINSFAGIYSEINGTKRFSIITTTPNELVKPIHNRMPVILSKSSEKVWLKPEQNQKKLLKLLVPFDSAKMNAHPISTLVNSPKNNSPEILFPSNARQQRLL
jgi:putative SOS response-associated peptidase YedK